MDRHPTPEQILAWLDGELADAAAESHIAACAVCREEAEALRAATNIYREHLHQTRRGAPPPPRAWKDSSELMVHAPSRRRAWMAIAAALFIGAFAIWRFATPENVSAAELLRKAESNAAPHAATSRIAIRGKRDRIVRPAVWRRLRVRGASEDRLRTLFASANYDWDNPLSVHSYNAWRQSVTVRRESVDVQPRTYVVHTEPAEGVLREATISLHKSDLHPVACQLLFRDGEAVEVTEAEPEPASEIPSSPSPSPIAAERKPQPSSTPTASLELQVAEVLHRIGADLGDPVEIESEGGSIVVTATGLDPRKSEQLRAALALPGVEARFVTPPQAPSTESLQAATAPPRTNREWEQRLAGRFTYEEYADRVLAATEGMTARAYALKALAERFPESKVEQLSTPERAVLDSMVADHVAAMRTHVQRLDQLLAILDPAAESIVAGSVAGDWRARALRLHALSTAADLAASSLFSPGTNANPHAIRAAVLRVAAALEEWR